MQKTKYWQVTDERIAALEAVLSVVCCLGKLEDFDVYPEVVLQDMLVEMEG